MKRSVHYTIYGEPASKANSRRLVTIGGRARFIKSQKALDYVASLREQVRPIKPLMTGDLRMTAHIYYASRRPDLDASLILDALQGVAYENDRQIKEQHLHHHIDRDDPRAVISLEEMTDDDE